MDIRDKIDDFYTKYKYRFRQQENTPEFRNKITQKAKKYLGSLGEYVEIKCDEENNPPALIDGRRKQITFYWDMHIHDGQQISLIF